jgi:hypothetical protein
MRQILVYYFKNLVNVDTVTVCIKLLTFLFLEDRRMTRIYTEVEQCVISGFRREVDQKCAPLGYQDASTMTFRDKPSVPSSKVKTFPAQKKINNNMWK